MSFRNVRNLCRTLTFFAVSFSNWSNSAIPFVFLAARHIWVGVVGVYMSKSNDFWAKQQFGILCYRLVRVALFAVFRLLRHQTDVFKSLFSYFRIKAYFLTEKWLKIAFNTCQPQYWLTVAPSSAIWVGDIWRCFDGLQPCERDKTHHSRLYLGFSCRITCFVLFSCRSIVPTQ